MTKNEAIKKFAAEFSGKKPTSITDLNSRYYVLSVGELSYSLDKRTGAIGAYNPILDWANFNRAIQNGRYEML